VDARSDVFSAGAVFYYMLTGRKPFAAPDLTAVLMKVQTQDPLPIRETEAPPQLVSLVQKALAKHPDDRYQTCGQMSTKLARARRELRAEVERWLDQTTQLLEAIDAVANEHRALIAGLEIAPAPTDFEAARVGLRAKLASLSDEARSGAVGNLLAEAGALHGTVFADVERWRTASSALDQGIRAARVGALRQALDHFELALCTEAGSRRAAAELDRCRRLIAVRRDVDERVTALLEEARNAMAAKQWQAAAVVCGEVLRLDSDCAEALALQLKAAGAIEAEVRERKREAERSLARADSCLRKGHFEEARRELAHARGRDPGAPELQALEERLLDAIAQSDRESALAKAAAAVIDGARRTFAAGDRERAIDELRAFHSASPVPSVASEIVRLEREARERAADEARAAEAAAHTAGAQAALRAGDPDLALDLANRALAIASGHVLAREVASLAHADIKQREKARARIAAAGRNLEKARQEIARGRFEKARALVAAAAELNPTDEEHGLVRDLIQQEETRVTAEAERQRSAKQRAKAADPILRRAAAALAHGDYENAAWSAENALAVDPECEQARQILGRSRERLAAEPERADDTVDLTDDVSADPDDTVTLLPPTGFWRRTRDFLRSWLGASRPLGADQSGRR
jgi:tetratricopeptide (TPR) repeat protein